MKRFLRWLRVSSLLDVLRPDCFKSGHGTPVLACITCGQRKGRHRPCLDQNFQMACPYCHMRVI